MTPPDLPPTPEPRPCSRCGGERDRSSQRYCRDCRNIAKRESRARVAHELKWRRTVMRGLMPPDLPPPKSSIDVSRQTLDETQKIGAVTVRSASTA